MKLLFSDTMLVPVMLLLIVATSLVVPSSRALNLTVGYLYADRTARYVKVKQGRIISGAMTHAINTINSDPDLLTNHTLSFFQADMNADTLVSTARLTEQWRDGAIAFFGPEEDVCDVEARVAAAWNLPLIAYKCADDKVSDKDMYPTFARTFPPVIQVTKSIISLLLDYNWRRFTIVAGSSGRWQAIGDKVEVLADVYNLTVNARFHFPEPHEPSIDGNQFPELVARSYIDTRVYVFLGEHNGMVDMMNNLESRGLLATGEYVLIHTDLGTFDTKNPKPLKYFHRTYDPVHQQRNIDAAASLLVIMSSPASSEGYEEFKRIVDDYNKKAPFFFPNPFLIQKAITVYAAYLYDAVMLYARALDAVLKEGKSHRDGRAICMKIRSSSYMSIQGFLSYIDENGDAEGNYTVLSRQPYVSEHGNYSMLPVGHFVVGNGNGSFIPTFKLKDGKDISWVNHRPPLDEPPCGYRGERCVPAPNFTMEIVCGVLGGLLFIAGIIILIIYRYNK